MSTHRELRGAGGDKQPLGSYPGGHRGVNSQSHRDVVERFHVEAAAPAVEASATGPTAILGGFGAVVAHRAGNRIADYTTVAFSDDPELVLERRPAPRWPREATEVLVVAPDPLLGRYGRLTPLSQAWVDLFNRGGWQADRFVHHLARELFHDGTQAALPG